MAPSFPSNIFTCWNWKIQKERHRKNRIWAVGSLERRTRAWNSLEDYDPACWVQNIFSNLELLKGTHAGFFQFFFIKVQAIIKKINKSIQTRRRAKNAKSHISTFSMWIPPHLSRVGTFTVQLETNITVCIFHSSFRRAGEGREETCREQEAKESCFFQNCFFSHVCKDQLVQPWSFTTALGLVFGQEPGAPARSGDAMDLQWLDAPSEMWHSSPEPRHAVPSELSPPKAAKSQMNAHALTARDVTKAHSKNGF